MEAKFDLYFNHTLRDYLGYPETFEIIYGEPGKITLIPDQTSRLLELIKTDDVLREQLLDQIYKTLSESLNVGEIYFSYNGEDIIINFHIKFSDVSNKDIGLIVNIAKNLPMEQIDEFCRIRKDFNNACRNQSFWKLLLKEQFPEYFHETRDVYNWEKVYRGIVWYEENKGDEGKKGPGGRGTYLNKSHLSMINFWKKFMNEYNEAFNYIFKKLNLNPKELKSLVRVLGSEPRNTDKIGYLLNKYPPDKHRIIHIFKLSIGKNPELLKLILNYHGVNSKGEPIELNKEHVRKTYYKRLNRKKMGVDEFKLLYEYLDGSYSPQSLLDQLSFMLDPSDELLLFIFDMLPPDPQDLDLRSWFIDNIRAHHFKSIAVIWQKYLQNSTQELFDILNGGFPTADDLSNELLKLLQRQY